MYTHSRITIMLVVVGLVLTALVPLSVRAEAGRTILSTYLGGANNETSQRGALVRDAEGAVFIISFTASGDFPYTSGAYDTSYNGNGDICISKFSSDLSVLEASTFFGSSGNEFLRRNTSLTIDESGNIYVAGQTMQSPDFPTTPGAYDQEYRGNYDIFIAKFSNDLSTLQAATLFGSYGYEEVCNIALDASGNIFIAGYTRTSQFPVLPGAYSTTYSGTGSVQWGGDIFVSKFSNDLSTLMASTFLGGSDWEEGSYMAIDSSGNVCLAGSTNSHDFPYLANGYDTLFGGGSYAGDIYISKLSNDLSTLLASTFIGGAANDWCYGLTLDKDDNIVITGHVASADFPVTPGCYDPTYTGGGTDWGDDIIVSKLTGNLDSLVASTFFGHTDWENGNSVIIDDSGYIYVGGNTNSEYFDFYHGVFDSIFNGGWLQYSGDAIIGKFNGDLTQLISSTYLGGIGQDAIESMVLGADGRLYVSGYTNSSNFPFNPSSFDTLYGGGSIDPYGGDAFLTAFPASCFTDVDTDNIIDFGDNCPYDYDPDQEDTDEDGVGDTCDNCIYIYNPGQEDINENGTGDVCDYICGDADGSSAVNILDVSFVVSYLYKGGPAPNPSARADVDHSGSVNILDVGYTVSYLYKGGPAPNCP